MVAVGEQIKGKYRVERMLGQGGMGFVVAAQHVALDQRVAIKFLHPAMLAHPDIVERFAREARAASRITSDHVARVIDVDALEDGTPFIVMELLEGSDLSTPRRERRPLPPHLAATYVIEACEAIGEAHRLGIVHRDIKPANLFLAQRAGGKTRTKVLDFGISKMATGEGASVTRTTAVIGSAEYMSPEQMLSTRDVDARTDIWALGVSLYEILTATVPFPGETITQVCALVMSKTPAPPSSLRPEIPRELDAVVLKCLEKDREFRYSSVEELAAALAPFTAPLTSARSSSPAMTSPLDRPSYGGTVALAGGNAPSPSNASAPSIPLMPATQVAQASSPSHGYPQAPAVAVVTAPPLSTSTTGAVSSGSLSPAAPKKARGPLVAGVVAFGAFAVIGIVGLFALRGPSAPSAAATMSGASTAALLAQPAVATEAPAASDSPAVSPGAAAPPATASEPTPVEPAAASAPGKVAQGEKAKARVGAPAREDVYPSSPVRPAPRKANCTPPFVVDANGIKHVKPECT